jgi:hypothetical protein
MDLEEVWRIREEDVYPRLFGPVSRGIFPLPHQMFAEQFGRSDVDPRWLFYGVIEFAPTAERPWWLYVTSGHSNPWEQAPEQYEPEADSGAGVEFTLASSEQGDWAIRTLQSMLAFDLLLGAGRFGDAQPLALHDRIPLRAPLDGRDPCVMRHLALTAPEGIPPEFGLPSGNVLLMGFTGLSNAEASLAKEKGTTHVIERLRAAGYHPVNQPLRPSIL